MKNTFSRIAALTLSLFCLFILTAPAARFSGGPGGGTTAGEATASLGAPPVFLSLPEAQTIERTFAAVPAATLTVSNASPASITAAGNLRITIPPLLPFVWDETVTTPVFGGSAAGKVNATVSYVGDGRTEVIDVTADFAAHDVLSVGGLAFTNLLRVCAAEALELDIHNNSIADARSDHGVRVTVWRPGGLGDGAYAYAMTEDVRLRIGGTLLLIR